MRKSICTLFFETYLREVSKGRGYRDHENPAVQFSKNARNGAFNEISDQFYDILLEDAEDTAEFWLKQRTKPAVDVLRIALENIEIDEESLHKLAEILSECYQTFVKEFCSEDLDHESDKIEHNSEGMPYFPDDRQLFYNQEKNDINDYTDSTRKVPEIGVNSGKIPFTPPELFSEIETQIYGQKEALRAAVMLLYNHMQGRKRNILFMGPTGCGKTEIWRYL